MGNICRSPMAERLLAMALRERMGSRADELYRSHGAGTGSWHVGDAMNPPAAGELARRGGDPSGFRARLLSGALIEESDLILCATSVQVERVLELVPAAMARTFVIGEFGRQLRPLAGDGYSSDAAPAVRADHDGPPLDAAVAYERAVALVAAVDKARASARSLPDDDLDDPYGLSQAAFARAADEIEETVIPLAILLAG